MERQGKELMDLSEKFCIHSEDFFKENNLTCQEVKSVAEHFQLYVLYYYFKALFLINMKEEQSIGSFLKEEKIFYECIIETIAGSTEQAKFLGRFSVN